MVSETAENRRVERVPGQLHREQNMAIRYRFFNRLDPGGAHFVGFSLKYANKSYV